MFIEWSDRDTMDIEKIDWDDPNLMIDGETKSKTETKPKILNTPKYFKLKQLEGANKPLTEERLDQLYNLAFKEWSCDVDFRPFWNVLTDDWATIELIQVFREVPRIQWMPSNYTQNQKEHFNKLKRLSHGIHISLVWESWTAFHNEPSPLLFLDKRERELYSNLIDWYRSFFNLVQYGFNLIQRYSQRIFEETENELTNFRQGENRVSNLRKLRKDLEELQPYLSSPKTILREAVVKDFEAFLSIISLPYYYSSPSKQNKLREIDYRLRENPDSVKQHIKDKYHRELTNMKKPFLKYEHLRTFCLEALEIYQKETGNEVVKRKLSDYRKYGDGIDLIIKTLQHPRHAKATAYSYGSLINS